MAMCWLGRACPYCGGSLYYGTDRKPGYKGNEYLAKCLSCSRMIKVTILDRARVLVGAAP